MGFLITKADGSRVPFAEGGLLANVETVDAAKTLTAEDSGKVFVLSAAAGAAITLPAAASGLCYKFIVGSAFATTDWTIVAAAQVIQGTVIVDSTAVNGADEDTISFVASAETVGDHVSIKSDGTNWYVEGVGFAAGGITLTQA